MLVLFIRVCINQKNGFWPCLISRGFAENYRMNYAYLASLQFVESVALPVPRTLDILEREMSI